MKAAWVILFVCSAISGAFVAGGIVRAAKGPDLCTISRAQTQAIRKLIINGTRRSKALDPQLVKLGFDPYSVRIRQARRDAASIPSC